MQIVGAAVQRFNQKVNCDADNRTGSPRRFRRETRTTGGSERDCQPIPRANRFILRLQDFHWIGGLLQGAVRSWELDTGRRPIYPSQSACISRCKMGDKDFRRIAFLFCKLGISWGTCLHNSSY